MTETLTEHARRIEQMAVRTNETLDQCREQIRVMSESMRARDATIDLLRNDVKALGGDPDASSGDVPATSISIAARAGIVLAMGTVEQKQAYLRDRGWRLLQVGWVYEGSGAYALSPAVTKQATEDMKTMKHLLDVKPVAVTNIVQFEQTKNNDFTPGE